MRQIVVSPSVAKLCQTQLPGRLQFAQDGGQGVLVHAVSETPTWGQDMDRVAQAAGFASYEALVAASTDYDSLKLRLSDYLTRETMPDPWSPPVDVDFTLTAPKLQRVMHRRNAGGFVEERRWVELQLADDGFTVETVAEVMSITYAFQVVNLFPIQRTKTIRWYRQDGTFHPTTKQRRDFYVTPEDQAVEGSKRRRALLDEAIGTVGMWLQGAGLSFLDGQAFAASLGDTRDRYVNDTSPDILTAIQVADGYAWLDDPQGLDATLATPVRNGTPLSGTLVTPRQYLLGVLNIYAGTL